MPDSESQATEGVSACIRSLSADDLIHPRGRLVGVSSSRLAERLFNS